MIAAITIPYTSYMGILNAISILRSIFVLIIFVWAIFSWFPNRSGIAKDIYNILDKIAGPIVRPFQKIFRRRSNVDFSPLIAFLVIMLIAQILTWIVGFVFTIA